MLTASAAGDMTPCKAMTAPTNVPVPSCRAGEHGDSIAHPGEGCDVVPPYVPAAIAKGVAPGHPGAPSLPHSFMV
jgi:hypothetical protein